ncbi:hypothetical protein KBP30_41595 [Streptomyces sp. Go40/10]|uniref:hypothetical protein n=1 Tax=Streptomyces sp. Go40/10 TaxID=2825844 RepID=UPI001E4011D3|nr:hypothetical protein [Streptomyces sp. Go40/10]UFQ99719.1 hypothetical protein KBP30_00010 [Streptomyces sp. Go40/10]UFR07227.1 hypothetical protein KBP30_41595 [Streptomyces sp. Go40/10]
MEEAQTMSRTGEPVTQAEEEQAGHALRELARSVSGPEALGVSQEQLDAVVPFFVLGWAMGVRTGHTAPAVAGVPVDQETVTRVFTDLMERVSVPQCPGPALWQKVDYHGSVTQRHGALWVCAIHVYADPFGGESELRYDLCEMRGVTPVTVVTGARRTSLTPLPVFRVMG